MFTIDGCRDEFLSVSENCVSSERTVEVSQHQPVLPAVWDSVTESAQRFLKGREMVVAVTEGSEGDEREGGEASGRKLEGIEPI
jgi:hypothetical protein